VARPSCFESGESIGVANFSQFEFSPAWLDSAAIPKPWAQTTKNNAKYRALGENFVWNHGDDSHLRFVLNEPREPTRSYPQEAHMSHHSRNIKLAERRLW
jgi:hypothetical protein